MEQRFSGKNAIVTGANRGLGLAIVKELASNGCNVYACMRKCSDEINQLFCQIESVTGVIIKPIVFDLLEGEAVAKSVLKPILQHTPIDFLINNAGIGHMGLFQMLKMDDVRRIYNVNLFAPMFMTQLVLGNMKKKGGGRIINVASTAAQEVYEGNAIYGSSKAALVAFTKSLAAETMRWGITVNAIAPGLLETDMSAIFEGAHPEEPIKHSALERKIMPEEVAKIITHLLAEDMNIINGEVITIHGGHR